VVGALAGAVFPSDPDLFGPMENAKIGTTGNFLVVSPKDRVFVSATDKTRIMQPLPAKGINPLLDRRIEEGFEGPAVTTTSLGVQTLNVTRGMKTTGWIVLAGVATAEAFAPIATLQRQIYLAALLMTLVMFAILRYVLARQFAPLDDAGSRMQRMTRGEEPLAPLPVLRNDEIGALVGNFNRLIAERIKLDESLRNEIAERRRAEDLLRANEELMRSTFEQAAVGIAHIEVGSYSILMANEKFCQLLGYTRDELVGSDSRVLTPDDEMPAREGERATVLSGKVKTSTSERRLIMKNGATLWVNRSLSLVRDATGQPKHFISVIEDISARKETEEARARLAAVAENSNDAIFLRDMEGKIVYWNDGATRMYGYTAAEALGRESAFLVPPELLAERAHDREQVKQGLTVPAHDSVRIRKGGMRLDVSISVSPVKNHDGKIIGAAIAARDITERIRKTALMQLQESLARATNEATTPELAMQACLERICVYGNWPLGHFAMYAPGDSSGVAPISYWRCEDTGRFADFMSFSDNFSHNTPSGQFVGVAIRERRPVWIEDLTAARNFGRVSVGMKYGIRAGFVFPVIVDDDIAGFIEFFATEARAPDQQLLDAILSIASQLARLIERSRAAATLAALNAELEMRVTVRTAELETANKQLASFSYTVAHDLRTPLRAINGFSAMVLQANEGKLTEASVGHLKRILAGSVRMGELIDDLLDLTRVSNQQIRRHHIDLSALAASAMASLSEAHPERKIGLSIQPGMNAYADAGLMRIVLDNLIGNAWKFTAKTAAPTIQIGSEERDGEMVYYVRDNGAGFDMAYKHKLFAPFQRLHHIHEFQGTGIGLATVKNIIARHGGRIWLDSAVNAGTTAFFTLGGAA
jgi:PAS domain S-box-containing protein